jgi:hypothetical protein
LEDKKLNEQFDLVCHAVITCLSENKGKRYYNHAIQFSSFAKQMYCLYFRNNNIFDVPQLVVPTILSDNPINKFETLMLNKNIDRVAQECLYIVHCEKQDHIEIEI